MFGYFVVNILCVCLLVAVLRPMGNYGHSKPRGETIEILLAPRETRVNIKKKTKMEKMKSGVSRPETNRRCRILSFIGYTLLGYF